MHYYKTTIQYDGSNFAGFQWQKDIPTVQREFNNALSLTISGHFTTMSASRTDSGVHAMDQIVKISAINPVDCNSFVDTVNKSLPSQIKCIRIDSCNGLFRPAAEARSKEYRYFFTNKSQVLLDETRFIANISNNLDLDLINKCIQALLGEHDFCNFYSRGSNVNSTIRNIFCCELAEINPQTLFSDSDLFIIPIHLTHCFEIKIKADGFLKQMIRHIVSALWMVGSGKLSTDDFMKLLDGPKSKKQMWKVASPNGLFLYKVNY